MFRELHWTGIVFGTGAGLIASYFLFAFSGPLGGNLIGQLVIQFVGFGVAGLIAGRFSLVHGVTSGRISALLLFFIIAAATIAAGAAGNIIGLLVLGVLALIGGTLGAEMALRRRDA